MPERAVAERFQRRRKSDRFQRETTVERVVFNRRQSLRKLDRFQRVTISKRLSPDGNDRFAVDLRRDLRRRYLFVLNANKRRAGFVDFPVERAGLRRRARRRESERRERPERRRPKRVSSSFRLPRRSCRP